MVRSLAALLAAVLATLVSLPAEAQWKWRDKGGAVQYSDLPPPSGIAEQDILARPGAARTRAATTPATPASQAVAAASAASGNALAPRTVDPELEAKRKKADAEQAAKVKADEQRIAVARADNCTRARNQIKTLDSGIRLARANEKGEREFLDDKQRAEEMKRARDAATADCR